MVALVVGVIPVLESGEIVILSIEGGGIFILAGREFATDMEEAKGIHGVLVRRDTELEVVRGCFVIAGFAMGKLTSLSSWTRRIRLALCVACRVFDRRL